MKMKMIKEMTDAELDRQLDELRKEKFNLRMQSKKTGQLENPARTKQVRQDIARVLTERKLRSAAAPA